MTQQKLNIPIKYSSTTLKKYDVNKHDKNRRWFLLINLNSNPFEFIFFHFIRLDLCY